MANPEYQFLEAICQAGIESPNQIIGDGKIHRFSSNGKPSNKNGWYVFHTDGIPNGVFGDWSSDLMAHWKADIGRSFTPDEIRELQAKKDFAQAMAGQEKAKVQAEAKEDALKIWNSASLAKEHPYLQSKGIKPHGTRILKGDLLIPMLENREIVSMQTIQADGVKRFFKGGKVSGAYFTIGEKPSEDGVVCIAEGFATGASIQEATGYMTVIAFTAGNLLSVAKTIRDRLPKSRIVICADDDWKTNGIGETKGRECAIEVGGLLALPVFEEDKQNNWTDFNDMAQSSGLDSVKKVIEDCLTLNYSDLWPNPQPLAAKVEPEPYPLDALPLSIRAAVEEVASFVKAPVPMVASSALAALSLAIQSHVDVKRAEKLHGPVGLFLLTIADSGERKSTCDGFFTRAIRDYEEAQAEAAKPALKDYKAAIDAWEAKRNGIKEKIRRLAKEQKATTSMESALRVLEHDKPEPPRIPRLLYADATPEALAYGLAKQWPSGGVVSAEAGIVFGSHGMGKDSVMRNLGLLNQLWDGTSLTIDRRSTESFTVRGARLTVALQVQEPTLREFFTRSGALARGSGFLARFLVAWPESTQGQRPFTDPPANWPHLTAFHRRIAAILDQPVPIDEDGALTPPMLPLTPEAKEAWVKYHNAIEGELSSGGELYDVRDVASKSADNAARLAALFQMFEAAAGAIGADAFEGASRITAWHLHEARRFFGELALPAELADAARLDSWLIEYCQRERTHLVPTREAQRLGPIRDKAKLTAALRELEELDRVKVTQEGRRKAIKVNPALVVTP